MPRYIVQLSYKGTNYHGWQLQDNAPTIQQFVNNSLSIVFNTPIDVIGAGRTDAGVHAKRYIIHFDCDKTLPYPAEKVVYKLNSILPNDIAIEFIQQTTDTFHARFDAVSRTYKYFISQSKNPFEQEFLYRMFYPLNIDAMNIAAETLYDYRDFTSFSKLHTDVKTNNCIIIYAHWGIDEKNMLVFTIKADRFLRNMVRAIVGTLLEVGRGKITVDEFRKIIEQKDRGKAGVSVPAQGLFLWDVEYNNL